MFEKLVAELREHHPGFGRDMVIDSKAIPSLSNNENKEEKADGRRDKDADYGRNEYRGIREDGTAWEKIDIRNAWKDPDKTRQLSGYENVVYTYKGNVYCHNLDGGEKMEMALGGFEKDRNTLKKLCPAMQYGIECKYMDKCSAKQGIRIKLDEDRLNGQKSEIDPDYCPKNHKSNNA